MRSHMRRDYDEDFDDPGPYGLAPGLHGHGPVLSDQPDLPTSTVQKDRGIGLLPVIGLLVLGVAIASSGGGGDRRVVCTTETPTEPDDDC